MHSVGGLHPVSGAANQLVKTLFRPIVGLDIRRSNSGRPQSITSCSGLLTRLRFKASCSPFTKLRSQKTEQPHVGEKPSEAEVMTAEGVFKDAAKVLVGVLDREASKGS